MDESAATITHQCQEKLSKENTMCLQRQRPRSVIIYNKIHVGIILKNGDI